MSGMSSGNEWPKPAQEKRKSESAKHGAEKCEVMRVPGYPIGKAAELVEMQALLRLTVPHLSNAEEDHAERNQKSIVIAGDDSWNRECGTRQRKRNGPLAVILDVLRLHRRPACQVEILCRFNLSEDGRFTQELVLPPGWRVVSS